PMLNAKLLKKDSQPGWFYRVTEPFYQKMDEVYGELLAGFLKVKWLSFAILILCGVAIWMLFTSLPQELAPLEDRSGFRMAITAPEGASFEYTDQYLGELSEFFLDTIPEIGAMLTVTAPGFAGSGGLNTGFIRMTLKEP